MLYKDDLNNLININFDKPDVNLTEFAEKYKLDLKEPNVRLEFIKLKQSFIDKIRQFYENNVIANSKSYNNNNNDKEIININSNNNNFDLKNPNISKKKINLKLKDVNKVANINKNEITEPGRISFYIISIILLFLLLVYYMLISTN